MLPGPSTSIDMGSCWLLLLLLLLSRERVFNLPNSASVWVLASHSPSTNDSVVNRNLSCPSTSASMPHSVKGPYSTEESNSSSVTETPTSKSQDQTTSPPLPTSPQGRSTAGPTAKMTSTVRTPVVTITTSMSLSDSTVTSTVKESIGTSKTTVLFSLTTSTETTQLNQTPTSGSLDKVSDTNKPSPMTTMAVTNTSSPTTAIPRTTVLNTATTETQERDTTAVPPTLGTIYTMDKSPDTHQSTVTQTHSQPAQMTSDVSTSLGTTPSAPKSKTTGLGSSMSPSPGDTDRTVMTPSATLVLSTPEHATPPSGNGTPTVPEKSTLTLPSSTLKKVSDTNKPLLMTTMAVTNNSSPTTAIPRTTVLSTATTETQERDTTAVPPTLGTIYTMNKPPDTHQSTVTLTRSQPAQAGSTSIGTATTQSPEHSTALIHSSSDITKSPTTIGTSPASPNSSQSSGLGGGACALDEYPDSAGACMCNNSYYSHLELSREIGTLRCRPQDIEVALRTCFLKTHHWVLKKDAFSSCSSINTTEQGRRVQVFHLMKKEGTCGLHISTNTSHALHSLDVYLEPAVPGSNHPGVGVLHFSCAYPLVVNVSKPVSYQEDSIPTIHVPSAGETVITLSIFTNPELTTPLKNSTAPVGMTLYVALRSTNSDPDRFVLVANEVFASSNPSNTEAKATYYFVKESCPVQGRLLQDLSNGASVQVILAFTLSRFLSSDKLYLHAQVTLCDKQASRPCQPSCSGKTPLQRNSPWDSQAGTRLEPGSSKWIIFGPLGISAPRASSSRSRAGAWMFPLFLMVVGWMLE
ncbi:mucin-17-like [Mesocricetus auratus]|uniref:Mucin-17-like n=1 Tax=Mesocricetus auratus TaxID=10036 RepID=A0A1U8CIY3_MESAU|nr:mucin-17-like [Mesocricetus auratus]